MSTVSKELELARKNYARGDLCRHLHPTMPFRIPKCDFVQVDCMVCGKILQRVYDQ